MAQKMPKIFIEYLRLVNRIHSHASFLLTFDKNTNDANSHIFHDDLDMPIPIT